jgi:hypothetical protein
VVLYIKTCIWCYKSLPCETVTRVHQGDSYINIGRGIEFESESGLTATAIMCYSSFHDIILPQFTYEEALTFPGDGCYTGPYVQKLFEICVDCGYMIDSIFDGDPIACIFCY